MASNITYHQFLSACSSQQERLGSRGLPRLGAFGCQDLLRDRFATKPRPEISSTPRSQILDDATAKNEETILKFVAPELGRFLPQSNDANLFVKLLISDGIDSWLGGTVCKAFLM